MSRLPTGWTDLPFGEVASIPNGQVDPRKNPYSRMLYVGPENIPVNGGRLVGDIKSASELSLISGKYLFSEKHVLYSKIRPNLNKVYKPLFSGLCSADIYPIMFDGRFCLAEYGYHYLRSEVFLRQSIAASMRSGLPKVNRDDLENMELRLPPIDEQKRIAKLLSAWDQAVEIAETATIKYEFLQHIRTKQLTWRIESGWTRLADILTSSNKRVGIEQRLPVYSITRDGLIKQSDYFSKKISSGDISRYMIVHPGQLALSGLNFWLGSVDVNTEGMSVCISPDYKVFSISDTIDSTYFSFMVKTVAFKRLLRACSTERASVVRRNFSRDLFLGSAIPIPDIEYQRKCGQLLENMQRGVVIFKGRAELIRTQKKLLTKRMLSGRWRLTDIEQVFPPGTPVAG